jgi:hypothetical protein
MLQFEVYFEILIIEMRWLLWIRWSMDFEEPIKLILRLIIKSSYWTHSQPQYRGTYSRPNLPFSSRCWSFCGDGLCGQPIANSWFSGV